MTLTAAVSTGILFSLRLLLLGGELFDALVEVGYFSEDRARHSMRQILAAVAYCHAEKIAHRDLKVWG